jgi:hypothetical protein
MLWQLYLHELQHYCASREGETMQGSPLPGM